jgi:hypothetical protein
MSSDLSLAIVTAVLGLLTAGVLALINNWINVRAGRDENLRVLRLQHYPDLWATTEAVSRWRPRTIVDRSGLDDLQRTLGSWYFGQGGLFMSERSAARYGDVQALIAALLAAGTNTAVTYVLIPDRYRDLMETASSLRMSLMDDLDTRRRSAWYRFRLSRSYARRHRATLRIVSQLERDTESSSWHPGETTEEPSDRLGTTPPSLDR